MTALRSLLALAIVLGGCTRRDHAAVMDRIEAAARLPPGALAIQHYARAYASGPGRQVIAVYFLPATSTSPNCDATGKRGVAVEACARPIAMAAGERRWFARIPTIATADGARCVRIDVRYDLDTHRVTVARCRDPGVSAEGHGGGRSSP